MPIREDLKPHYGAHWIEVIRPQILARAGNSCEQCRKPNGRMILTVTGHRLKLTGAPAIENVMYWTLAPIERRVQLPGRRRIESTAIEHSPWRNHRGQIDPAVTWNVTEYRLIGQRDIMRLGPVKHRLAQIGIAHLNNVAGDDRPENLRALCTWCHLVYDLPYHLATRAAAARLKHDAGRELLDLMEEEGTKIKRPKRVSSTPWAPIVAGNGRDKLSDQHVFVNDSTRV